MINAATMSELLGGPSRFKALRCLYEQPERAFGTRELAAEAGVDPGNVSRWLRRWSEVGLVKRREERGAPVFQASDDVSLVPLAQLLQQSSRMSEVLRVQVDALGDQISAAAIFGSAASGTTHAESDVDLLLLTSLPRLKAQAHFKAAGRELGRPVNVVVYTARAWHRALADRNPFVMDVMSKPVVLIKGALGAAET
ncbi:MarR family transcriptional regulator [Ramlibacter sp.]|uniref:MarR family transcriptional regulator n=1 Tax=Ramlibacter sp. TaxID=1917967 RepID=UPI003D13C907